MNKRKILLVGATLCFCFYSPAEGSHVNELVQLGKELLVSGDTQAAQIVFQSAVEIQRRHEEANFYLGMLRILNVYEGNPEAFELLLALGFRTPDGFPIEPPDVSIFSFLAEIPDRPGGGIDFSTDSPHLEDLKAFADTELKPQIGSAFRNFSRVSRSFVSILSIPGFLFFETEVEFDASDVMLAKSSLHALQAGLLFLEAYNVEGDLVDLYFKSLDGTLSYRSDLLESDPDSFAVLKPRATARAMSAMVKAINFYLEASDAIRNETDLQDNDAVHFDPLDIEAAQYELQFRNALLELRASLKPSYGQTFAPGEVHLKDIFQFGRFFERAIDVRGLQHTENVSAFLATPLGREVKRTLATVNDLTPDYTQLIPPEYFGLHTALEVDYSDALFARSLAQAYLCGLRLIQAYNHGYDAGELVVSTAFRKL